MKFIYKGIGHYINLIYSCLHVLSPRKQIMNKAEANDSCKIEVVVLDPGHFHASLLQKDDIRLLLMIPSGYTLPKE